MPQTRRTHTKSRGGCVECKRRKIKCGEERPICGGCEKRTILCEYSRPGSSPRDNLRPRPRSDPSPQTPRINVLTPVPGSAHNNEDAAASPRLTATGHSSPSAVSKSVSHFDLEDIALWHHFVTSTAKTTVWAVETEFLTLALSCDYLMHAVLSVSALHLAYLNPDQRDRYNYISAQHQDLALGPFQEAMSNITAENCHQVFAFSVMLLVSIYASSRSANFLLPVREVASGFLGFRNWITCLQGCRYIVELASPHIRSGPLRILVLRSKMLDEATKAAAALPKDEDSQSLDKLAYYLTSSPSIKSTTTVAEMEAYSEAITLLQKLLAAATTTINNALSLRSLMSFWPVMISDTFVRMLGENRPPALAIIAHYCLLLRRCTDCWYMDHRAHDLFEAVRQSLPDEWLPRIEHPLHVFKR